MPKKEVRQVGGVPLATDESLLADFDMLVKANKAGVDTANKLLPSGRFLHNPAKRTVKSVSRWASQQVENSVAASSDWLDGIKNPSRNPIEAAIDAEDKWKDKMQQAIREGRYKKGLQGASLSELIQVAEAVGTSGYETGIRARESKIKRVIGEIQPLVQSVSDAIQGLPDRTDAEREKRLTSARKLMIEAGKKRRGIS